ncbi:zinc-binding alcohol dehydrogenase family protein [Parendozoicomonas haliclonae]|uniref:Putative L-galactonate oxidoreductase n=1 Tax=Parendozoicomonas haliclonae TaxID=1960125 RepID=A0A1X7AGA0_9GAMM|nr:zinc-binding alcohol dehydrogenase family protein [Parendozoicomonas haliclonae]SMA39590.1 putative L-galactonate oxidoreductase [Parendozoicomonas haliclonae]
MKKLVCQEPHVMEYVTADMPAPKAGEILLKVEAVSICGTDIHAFGGNQPFFEYPRVLGHEICGHIAELGEGVDSVAVGERVAVIPYVACEKCPACQSGKTNCCEAISVIGVHQDGGFCEYLTVPAKNILSVGDVDPELAAFIEPFAISAHSVHRAKVAEGEHVLVVGAGPIGIGAAAIAKAYGAKVVVADMNEERLAHVRQTLGLATANPGDANYADTLKAEFDGIMPEKLIDATGNPHSMNNAVNVIRHGGTIVFVGLFKGNLDFSDIEFHKRETTMMGSRNATMADFAAVQKLMAEGKLSKELMLSHRFNFHEIGHTYQQDVVENKELVKGVILFN